MRIGQIASVLIISFVLFSFLLLAFPKSSYSQGLGCCINPAGGSSCPGCEGLACAVQESDCDDVQFMYTPGSYCVEGGCSDNVGFGCCVIAAGNCTQVVSQESCEVVEDGVGYFFGVACSQVPACSDPSPGPGGEPPSATNVPTLSQWSLIALAGILGVTGFVVVLRRKETA